MRGDGAVERSMLGYAARHAVAFCEWRNGAWECDPASCREAFQDFLEPHDRQYYIGFRLVIDVL